MGQTSPLVSMKTSPAGVCRLGRGAVTSSAMSQEHGTLGGARRPRRSYVGFIFPPLFMGYLTAYNI